MKCKKIIIFGTGKGAMRQYENLDKTKYEILCFLDNNQKKANQFIDDIMIMNPQVAKKQIDMAEKIVICSVYYDEIREQLLQSGVPEAKLARGTYFAKEELLEKYKDSEDTEIIEIVEYLKNHDLGVFNYEYTVGYKDILLDIRYDDAVELYYMIFQGKKMYLSRSFDSYEKAYKYCRFIMMEQDENSPHYYRIKPEEFRGKAVIDCGVAEGNFALSIVEEVEKLYLVECDEAWIDALKLTFRKYEEKVVIVPKLLSNECSQNEITIDEIARIHNEKRIDFIKMDIEGYEPLALKGAEAVLSSNPQIKMILCIYHNDKEYGQVKAIIDKYGMDSHCSRGYMFFLCKENEGMLSQTLNLRRGLLYVN